MAPLIIIYLEGYDYGKMSIRVDGYREGGTIPQSDEGRKKDWGWECLRAVYMELGNERREVTKEPASMIDMQNGPHSIKGYSKSNSAEK